MKHRFAAAVIMSAVGCTSVVASAAGVANATTPTDTGSSSAYQCIYKPLLPSQLAISKAETVLKVGLNISGTGDCAINFTVVTTVSNGTDKHYLNWAASTAPVSEPFTSSALHPGAYKMSNNVCVVGSTTTGAAETCTVVPTVMTVKYASTSSLRVAHSKTKVTFTETGRHWAPGGSKALVGRVAIQRLSGKKWHTIHTGTASAAGKLSWAMKATKKTKKASYRAVAAATSDSFGATSKTVTK